MAKELGTAPALSTPDTRILNDTLPVAILRPSEKLSDQDFAIRYEIDRTLEEIKERRWRRIALQFPDDMLPDSARVFQMLARGLGSNRRSKHEILSDGSPREESGPTESQLAHEISRLGFDDEHAPVKLTILADTSYGSCCADEVAAEHVDADVIVHYGRACLSPTARLPVIHVFTKQNLNLEHVAKSFLETFPDHSEKIILTADVPYASHIKDLYRMSVGEGYSNVFAAAITHDPASAIPNRLVPEPVKENPNSLRDWQLFHISEPPTSLLLTLSSRVAAVYIYPTEGPAPAGRPKSMVASTPHLLRRRYALITSLSTVSIWGILINTLSVKNYLNMVERVKEQIAAAGKKSYLFVVGKLNAAKVANFGEIGGWVVIGCWESSLIDSKDFYKPVITPFELDLALQRDDQRLWTGEWRGDFQSILDKAPLGNDDETESQGAEGDEQTRSTKDETERNYDSEEDSSPPEFDLRTGRYVSNSRPIRTHQRSIIDSSKKDGKVGKVQSSALTKRAKGDVVAINGVPSPAADYLRSQRTWTGLGSDFDIAYEEEAEGQKGSVIEEGRKGIARGYAIGDSEIS